MNVRFNISTSQALRDLTKAFKHVEDYPKTKLGTPRIAIQYQNNKTFQAILWKNLVQEWQYLGSKFTPNSIVIRNLKVEGGGSGRGVASYKAGFKTTRDGQKAFSIAEIWDKGGVILPRKVTFLTQPMSRAIGVKDSPREYNTDAGGEYTAFVDKSRHYSGSSDPRISQDVVGMLYIRERHQGYETRKKGAKVKRKSNIVARYLLLRSQTHQPTHWIKIAAKKTRTEILPIAIETGRQYIRSQKVLL